jgi:hypothetical protein
VLAFSLNIAFSNDELQNLNAEALRLKHKISSQELSIIDQELSEKKIEIDLETAQDEYTNTYTSYVKGFGSSINLNIAKEKVTRLDYEKLLIEDELLYAKEALEELKLSFEASLSQDPSTINKEELKEVASSLLTFWERRLKSSKLKLKLAQSHLVTNQEMEKYQYRLFKKGYAGPLAYAVTQRESQKAELDVRASSFKIESIEFIIEELKTIAAPVEAQEEPAVNAEKQEEPAVDTETQPTEIEEVK